MDARIIRQVTEGKGRIINSQDQVGGYPNPAPTKRSLEIPGERIDEWLATFSKPEPKN